ncbi:hypothetical protein Q7P35_005807 [Cladosporium inversicolor]
MAYRVEISATKQAGCQANHCKKEKVKIQKGEIRQGVVVDTGDFTSLKWRHWGCVTPYVLHNWWEAADHDFELVDGLDVMPADAQDKVKRALEQGHVDDDDWNGDVECNRLGKKSQGMFLKGTQKDGDDEAGTKKPAGKKRGRPAKTEAADEDDDEAEKPAAKKGKKAAAPTTTTITTTTTTEDATPKKGRGRPKKAAPVADAEDDAEVEVAPKKARGRPRKSLPAEEEKAEEVAEVEAPAAKKARGRPRKSVTTDVEDEVEAPVKKGRGRPKTVKPSEEAADEPAPKKGRGRPRKSVTTDVEDEVEAPVKKGRGRPKTVKPSEEAADEPAPKKGRGRPRKSVAADEE